jgi:superfamily II DNA/RNA helicase
MARHRWQDPIGRATIQRIIKAKILNWKDGLHAWQLDVVCQVLDLEDVLCTTATGDGKSALFGAPMVVLLEMAKNPICIRTCHTERLRLG